MVLKTSDSSKLLTILNSLDALVYVVDMETYELLFVNTYGLKTWGDIIGEKCYFAIQKGQEGPCDFCTNHLLVDDSGKPTGVYQWEFQNSKNRRWYDCRDIAIQWTDNRLVRLEIATDITRRKRLEEALEESERSYRRLAEDIPLLLCTFRPDTTITYANKSYGKYFGKEVEELVGTSFLHLVPPEEREYIKASISSLTPREPIKRYEHQVLSKDGLLRWQQWTNRAFFNEEGEATLYQSIGEDITDRKKAEEALQYQLAFERVLSQISALFVKGPIGSFDDNIKEALWRMGDFFHVDGVYLFLLSPDRERMHLTYDWCREGVEPHSRRQKVIPVKRDSWWYRQLAMFETIHIPSLHEVEEEILIESDFFLHLSIQSFLALPIRDEDRLLGFVAFDMVEEKRSWTKENLSLLTIAVEMISHALIRHQTEKELLEQERLRDFLIGLAKDFINITPEKIDGAIVEMLETMGEYIEVDAIYLFTYDPQEHVISMSYEWCAVGVAPQKDHLLEIPINRWYHSKESLEERETLFISTPISMMESVRALSVLM